MKKIIVSDTPWQTRVAVIREGRLQNVYFESHATINLERSFFKGIVTKILPGIQTAFVDIGQARAGFLHISEIDRELALQRVSEGQESDDIDEPIDTDEEQLKPHEMRQQARDIRNILKEGEPILVQVSKEPVYEKGAKLTTCFTLPGRFIVLMPNVPRIAISKKIEQREERSRLRDLVKAALPDGMGAIIRTTAEERQAYEITQDVAYLVETWHKINEAFVNAAPEQKIYEDIPLALQAVRDHLDDDVESIITDNKTVHHELNKFIRAVAPEYEHRLSFYAGTQDLFEKFAIDKEILEALEPKVSLPSGGSLIIETTQAMNVIDVNTAKFTGKTDLEETILKTNLEAAEEIVRQLRLRKIGGIIVIDFIDMALQAHRQKLIKHFEKMLKKYDKFQSIVLRISELGVVQMTRKRIGKTLQQELMESCSTCHGRGFKPSIQTECYWILPKIKQALRSNTFNCDITLRLHPDIFDYLVHTEYNGILSLEREIGRKITLVQDSSLVVSDFKIMRAK